MHREYHRWWSPSLHRDMELLVFGHAGARALVFPTSMGRFYEWEDRGMMQALRSELEQGQLQVFCVDSVDHESWYARGKHPYWMVRRHDEYDHYIRWEVLPFTQYKNANPYLVVTGASFGGYHAANFALRHPDQVGRLLVMSGLCDIRRFLHGHHDELAYYHNPIEFIANEHEGWRLAALRRMDIILAVGRDDGLRGSNEHLSAVLWSKGIWNAVRIWDGFAHDWPVWERMLLLYLGGHD